MPTALETRCDTQTLTPFFTVAKDVDYLNQLKIKHGQSNARELALKRFSGNFKFQAWEITDIPISDEFYYRTKYMDNQFKLIHESDENQLDVDILEVTSPQIRRGLEYTATQNWRQAILSAKTGESIFQINPKKEADETDCPYLKTQINIASKVSENLTLVRQIQCNLNTSQSALLLNRLISQDLLSPEPLVDEVIPTIAITHGHPNLETVLAEITRISGQKFDSFDNIDLQKQQISQASILAANRYLEAIESATPLNILQDLHLKLLKSTLPQKLYHQIQSSSAGFITSCGRIGGASRQSSLLGSLFINESKPWLYHNGDCHTCFSKNVPVGPCNICKTCESKFDSQN